MGSFFKDKKGYPRWKDSKRLVHRTIVHPKKGNVVHHRDGNKSNFRRSNLVEMSRSDHSQLHAKKKHVGSDRQISASLSLRLARSRRNRESQIPNARYS